MSTIMGLLDEPEALEDLYRANSEAFHVELMNLASNQANHPVARAWRARLSSQSGLA